MQNLFQTQSHQMRNDDGGWNGTHSCGKTEKKLTIQFLFGSDANAAESHEYWHFILTKNVVILSHIGWMITKLKTGGGPLCERSCWPGGAGSIFGPWPSQNPGLIHCKERAVKDPFTNTGENLLRFWPVAWAGFRCNSQSFHRMRIVHTSGKSESWDRTASALAQWVRNGTHKMKWVHRLKTPTALKCSECVVYPKMIANAQLKAHRFNRRGEW